MIQKGSRIEFLEMDKGGMNVQDTISGNGQRWDYLADTDFFCYLIEQDTILSGKEAFIRIIKCRC